MPASDQLIYKKGKYENSENESVKIVRLKHKGNIIDDDYNDDYTSTGTNDNDSSYKN